MSLKVWVIIGVVVLAAGIAIGYWLTKENRI
jgi:uncharacterized protein YneF (UPF0154 family)